MKLTKYLHRRGNIYYLRMQFPKADVRVSLQTKDLLIACELRDQILDEVNREKQMFGYDDDSEEMFFYRKCKEVLDRARLKNNGIVPYSFYYNDRDYGHREHKIKDQEFLEEILAKTYEVFAFDRKRNGGSLSEPFIKLINQWFSKEVLYSKFSEEVFEHVDTTPATRDNGYTGEELPIRDMVGLVEARKKALFNFAADQLKEEFSLPLTSNREESLKKLVGTPGLEALNELFPEMVNGTTSPTTQGTQVTPAEKIHSEPVQVTKTLRQVCDELIEEKNTSENANSDTVAETTMVLGMICEYFGEDTDINDVNERKTILGFKKALKRLPTYRTGKRFKGKSFNELIAENHQNTLHITTSNKYLAYFTSLMNYAAREDYIIKARAYDLQDKNPTPPRKQNDRFSEDELVLLFRGLREKFKVKKQERFWIPLIALFTSCRLNEICQLSAKDIRKAGGVWIFDITNESDSGDTNKALKTINAHRELPVHKTLIKLGLIDFLQSLPYKGDDNAWGLKFEDTKNKYGRPISREFNNFRKKLFNPPARTKTFHSLRHTFATFFRQVSDSELVKYFDGHSCGNETEDRYVKYDDHKWLKDKIDLLTYPEKVEKMFKQWISEHKELSDSH